MPEPEMSVSWKDYVDMRFTEQDKRVSEALAARETRARETERGMEKRLDGMNEFRQTINDNATKFITKDTYDANHKAIMDKVELLQKQQNFGGGREQGSKERTTNIYAAAAFVAGIIGTLFLTGVLK